jgi:hypothetical protein
MGKRYLPTWSSLLLQRRFNCHMSRFERTSTAPPIAIIWHGVSPNLLVACMFSGEAEFNSPTTTPIWAKRAIHDSSQQQAALGRASVIDEGKTQAESFICLEAIRASGQIDVISVCLWETIRAKSKYFGLSLRVFFCDLCTPVASYSLFGLM